MVVALLFVRWLHWYAVLWPGPDVILLDQLKRLVSAQQYNACSLAEHVCNCS